MMIIHNAAEFRRAYPYENPPTSSMPKKYPCVVDVYLDTSGGCDSRVTTTLYPGKHDIQAFKAGAQAALKATRYI